MEKGINNFFNDMIALPRQLPIHQNRGFQQTETGTAFALVSTVHLIIIMLFSLFIEHCPKRQNVFHLPSSPPLRRDARHRQMERKI